LDKSWSYKPKILEKGGWGSSDKQQVKQMDYASQREDGHVKDGKQIEHKIPV